ncbi:reverse transcriptase [Gossypium australe]|uniref:Reverse transcriptase n=1 Tax=Gossypium australe TaxID=47621 RepID=A0A5B6VQF5_9ROSI|nr:reverse transcriptase [Gossypium australe]
MKILSWNIRGLGIPRTVRRLRHSLKIYNPQMVFFMETNCDYTNGIEVDSDGTRGCLCLAWRNDINITLQDFSKRHIDVIVDDNKVRNKWRYTGFYGTPYAQDRDNSWAILKILYNYGGIPWFVCRDFNEIMYDFEKKRGLPRDERRMETFSNVLEECQLMDVGYSENWFTWERGNLPETNIQERLDRKVANAEWMSMFPEVTIQHLVHSFPIIVLF